MYYTPHDPVNILFRLRRRAISYHCVGRSHSPCRDVQSVHLLYLILEVALCLSFYLTKWHTRNNIQYRVQCHSTIFYLKLLAIKCELSRRFKKYLHDN